MAIKTFSWLVYVHPSFPVELTFQRTRTISFTNIQYLECNVSSFVLCLLVWIQSFLYLNWAAFQFKQSAVRQWYLNDAFESTIMVAFVSIIFFQYSYLHVYICLNIHLYFSLLSVNIAQIWGNYQGWHMGSTCWYIGSTTMIQGDVQTEIQSNISDGFYRET